MKDVFSWITAALCIGISIVFTAPHLFGRNVYAVASGSMIPTYPVGCLVFTREIPPAAITVGDCITYQSGSTTVTHRVVAIDREGCRFFTKGDANGSLDVPVEFSRLVGRTEDFSIPFLGYPVLLLKSRWGYAVVVIMAVIIIRNLAVRLTAIRKIRKERG